MKVDRTARDLEREANAAKGLIEALRGEDEDVVHDMTEGETGLMEAIDAALSELDDCDVTVVGCKAKEAEMAERRGRAERRQERIRTLIEQAMLVAGLPTAKRPTATISVADVAPKPVVTDEAAIPSDYWRQPDPVLDKSKINAAVKDGAEIPGVSMSNGTTKLTIRRK